MTLDEVVAVIAHADRSSHGVNDHLQEAQQTPAQRSRGPARQLTSFTFFSMMNCSRLLTLPLARNESVLRLTGDAATSAGTDVPLKEVDGRGRGEDSHALHQRLQSLRRAEVVCGRA